MLDVLTKRVPGGLHDPEMEDKVRNHTIVIGYGTTGKTAVDALLDDGVAPAEIVVVDTDKMVLDRAATAGLVTLRGDATASDVLRHAGAAHAGTIIIAASRDATAALVTLTARQLSPNVKIVASVREAENQSLLRRCGADSVVVSSETAGQLLGLAMTTPSVADMLEDLLTPQTGLAIAQREVAHEELGRSPRHVSDIVLAVVRNGELLGVNAPEAYAIQEGDQLLYIRSTESG